MKRLLLLSALFVLLSAVLSAPAVACCFLNKDVHNGTGQPAYDLEIEFSGLRQVLGHYDGYPNDWRFRQFSWWQAAGKTYLRWFDPVDPAGNPAPIPPCTWVHIGWFLDAPAPFAHGWWTDQAGNAIPNGHIQQPSHYVWPVPPLPPAPFDAQLVLVNDFRECPYPTIISNIRYAILPEELPLDSLNAQNSWLAGVLQPLAAGPFTIWLDSTLTIPIPEPIPEGYVLVYSLEGGQDTPNEFMDFGQHHWVEADIPTLTEWGMIIFGVVLLGFITWVFLKRRRTAVSLP
jgi:hypothetical protein